LLLNKLKKQYLNRWLSGDWHKVFPEKKNIKYRRTLCSAKLCNPQAKYLMTANAFRMRNQKRENESSV
jgi:hypothetical protein